MRFLAILFFVLGAADLVALDAFIGPAALAGKAGGADGARGRPVISAPASRTAAAATAPTPMPVERALPAPPPPRPLAVAAGPDPVALPDREPDPVPDPGDRADHEGALPHRLTIHFDLDSDELGHTGRATLDRAADLLDERAELAIEIRGHADESGSDDHNQDLSERRAHSVAAYLEERGVDPDRLDVRGFGESEPVDHGRERSRRNRRVEIRFSTQAAKGDQDP